MLPKKAGITFYSRLLFFASMKSRTTCVLIDDDLDDQEIFALALHQVRPDFGCTCVANGAEAIQMLSKPGANIPSYIFLDLNMPKMNGKECLRELKKLNHLANTPVIIYSTSSLKSDVLETRKLGAADFITKPYNMDQLLLSLEEFFVRHEQFIQITQVHNANI